jgi:hypothetical protein
MRRFAVDLCMIRCGRLVIEASDDEEAIDIAKERVLNDETEIDWPLFFQIDGVEEIS